MVQAGFCKDKTGKERIGFAVLDGSNPVEFFEDNGDEKLNPFKSAGTFEKEYKEIKKKTPEAAKALVEKFKRKYEFN